MTDNIDSEDELAKILPKFANSLCKEAFALYVERVNRVGVEKFREQYFPIFEKVSEMLNSDQFPAAMAEMHEKKIDVSNPLTYPHDEDMWIDLLDQIDFGELFGDLIEPNEMTFIDILMAGFLINSIQKLKGIEQEFESGGISSFDAFLATMDEPLHTLHTFMFQAKTVGPGIEMLRSKKARSDGGKKGGKSTNPLRIEFKRLVEEKAIPLIESGEYGSASKISRALYESFLVEGRGIALHDDAGDALFENPYAVIYNVVLPLFNASKKQKH